MPDAPPDERPMTDDGKPRPKLGLFPIVLALLLVAMSAWVVLGWFNEMRGATDV